MNKITLRKFYDTSGNYKVVRCKTFEEAKKFLKAYMMQQEREIWLAMKVV